MFPVMEKCEESTLSRPFYDNIRGAVFQLHSLGREKSNNFSVTMQVKVS